MEPGGRIGRRRRGMARIPVDALAHELRIACMRVSRRMRQASTERMPQGHLATLTMLESHPRSPGELASVEHVSRSVITRRLIELERAGLVQRVSDGPDRRRVQVRLTASGESGLASARKNRTSWMDSALRGLSASDRDTLERARPLLLRLAEPS
jgi:DNA-binding MarR family transcriptional regulator